MAVSYGFGGPQNGNFCQIHLELTVHKMIPGWHEFGKLPGVYKLADVCGCAENQCDSLNVQSVHSHMGIHAISWTYRLESLTNLQKSDSPILEPSIHNPHGFSCIKTHPNHHLTSKSKGHPSPLYRIPPWARNSPSHICTSKSKSSDVREGFTDHGHVQHIKNRRIYCTTYRNEANKIMELYMWWSVLLFSSDSSGWSELKLPTFSHSISLLHGVAHKMDGPGSICCISSTMKHHEPCVNIVFIDTKSWCITSSFLCFS